jgi:hypothetical protein
MPEPIFEELGSDGDGLKPAGMGKPSISISIITLKEDAFLCEV